MPIERAAHQTLIRHRLSGHWFNVSSGTAVAAISAAAFQLNDMIVSVDPKTVGDVIRLAANNSNKTSKAHGSPTLSPKNYLTIFLVFVFALGAWAAIANLQPADSGPVIVGFGLACLISYGLMSIIGL